MRTCSCIDYEYVLLFAPAAPNQAWWADLTYIWTDEGWLYLAVVVDLFNRKSLVGLSSRG